MQFLKSTQIIRASPLTSCADHPLRERQYFLREILWDSSKQIYFIYGHVAYKNCLFHQTHLSAHYFGKLSYCTCKHKFSHGIWHSLSVHVGNAFRLDILKGRSEHRLAGSVCRHQVSVFTECVAHSINAVARTQWQECWKHSANRGDKEWRGAECISWVQANKIFYRWASLSFVCMLMTLKLYHWIDCVIFPLFIYFIYNVV